MKRQPTSALVLELLEETQGIPVPTRELAALIFPEVDNNVAKFRIHAAVQKLREQGRTVETVPDAAGYRVRR